MRTASAESAGRLVVGYVVGADARRSPRCLIPSSIFRSITRDPGSIGSIPMREISLGSRNRLRLMRRVRPFRSSTTNVQTQLPSSERQARTVLRVDALDAHPVGAHGD